MLLWKLTLLFFVFIMCVVGRPLSVYLMAVSSFAVIMSEEIMAGAPPPNLIGKLVYAFRLSRLLDLDSSLEFN